MAAINPGLGSRLYDWVDERTGLSELLHEVLDEPIPGGASFAYVFGSALIFIFVMQCITGVFLAMYYVPSAEDAHKTVEYITKAIKFSENGFNYGSFIRGLHHYGSSAMVIMVACHILQIIIWGGYKKKREVLWLVGAGLLQMILVFSLSGYLLPWDMKAYYGTAVTVGIASEVPFLGDMIKKIIQGGDVLGTITISRFFMVHVFILPAFTAGGIAAHIYLFRKAKPAGPFTMSEQEAYFKVEPFYPKQVWYDMLFSAVVFIIMAYLAINVPAPLEPKADPSITTYVARPEWYFLALFQLLKYFSGPWAIFGSLILPGIVMAALTFLPFLDRSDPDVKNPLRRPVVMLSTLAVCAALFILTMLAKSDDKRDFGKAMEEQEATMHKFMAAPFERKVLGGAPAAPAAPAPAVFATNCAGCHGAEAQGQGTFPKLVGISKKPQRTKEDIVKLLENPSSYGLGAGMPAFPQLSEKERQEIAEWLSTLK